MRVSAAACAISAAAAAAVWAAVRVGVGYPGAVSLLYGCGFFVASVFFLGAFWTG